MRVAEKFKPTFNLFNILNVRLNELYDRFVKINTRGGDHDERKPGFSS